MSINIPITIVAGLPGAGKTTVLSNLIKQGKDQRITIVTYSQNNEFAGAMEALKDKSDVDRIIIETSEQTVPTPIMERLQAPALRSHFFVDATLLIVEAPLFLDGKFTSPDTEESLQQIFLWQLEYADVVVLNKIDYLPDNKLHEAAQQIKKLCPTVRFLELAYDAKLDDGIASILLHQNILDQHVPEENSGWISFAVRTNDWQEADHLKEAFQVISENEPVLRIKGTTRMEGSGEQLLFQGMRQRIEVFYLEPAPQKQLVTHKDDHHLHQQHHEIEHHHDHPHHHAPPEPRPHIEHHHPDAHAKHHHADESPQMEEADRRFENIMEEHGVQSGWLDKSTKGEFVFFGYHLNRDTVLKKLRTYTHTTWY